MITLSRYNELEELWTVIKKSNIIPENLRMETESNLLNNRLEVNVKFSDCRIKEDDLKKTLFESYRTIALVDPLVRDAANGLDEETKVIVTDPNGVIIACQSQDVIGYHCPAANLVNSDKNLKQMLERGKVLEVHYDNGIRSQLVPIFDEDGMVQFYWGISDHKPISSELSIMLYLAAQLIQQRYKYINMIDEYTNSFLNAIPECVVLLDETARIININERCLNLLDIYDRNVVKGVPISSLIDKEIHIMNEVLNTNNKHFTINLWEKQIHCEILYKQPIKTTYGNHLVLSFKQITNMNQSNLPALRNFNNAFEKIIGNTPTINNIKDLAKKAAHSSATILIEGESGTGKELFAEAIHQESNRIGKFITINCGAIPKELIQSELFGYEEGAFTGARKGGNVGKFEIADGGTVFLDEIGEMPLDIQVNLLRFLQDKKITRVGGYNPKKVDVRIIAATNRDLKEEVVKGNFREDLYYRLNIINVKVPPLRSRKEDIPLIADYLVNKLSEDKNHELLRQKELRT